MKYSWFLDICTDLNFPPPLPGIHISVSPEGHVCINVVSLRLEFEVWGKVMTTIDLCDTIKRIPVEDLKSFAVDHNLLLAELGAECW